MRSEAENRGIKDPKIHVYTGDGKGKTTAALGLGLRAAGSGYSVAMVQFLKDEPTGELEAIKKLPNFKVFRFQKKTKGFFCDMSAEEKEILKIETEEALIFAENLLKTCGCDVLILDEIFICLSCGIVSEERLIKLLQTGNSEIILTGRDAPESIRDTADYVSEIRAEKHPYDCGCPARCGIEY